MGHRIDSGHQHRVVVNDGPQLGQYLADAFIDRSRRRANGRDIDHRAHGHVGAK
jgi:hypothetical protein